MTSLAPSSRSQPRLRVEPVAITCAPKNAANCTAKWPTPPEPACTSIRCPSCAFAVSTTMPHAVSAASGTAAASTCDSLAGLRMTLSSVTVRYSAYAPLIRGTIPMPYTSVPGWRGCAS